MYYILTVLNLDNSLKLIQLLEHSMSKKDRLEENEAIKSLKRNFHAMIAEKGVEYAFEQLSLLVIKYMVIDGHLDRMKQLGYTNRKISSVVSATVDVICKKMDELEN